MTAMTLGEQLQAALAAKGWAEDDEAHKRMEGEKPSLFQVTNNLSRATFEHIKNNPDLRNRVTHALVAKGYKYNSVSAIIGHMLLQGIVQPDDEGVLHTTVPEYVPLKSAASLKRKKAQAQGRKKVIVNVRERTVREEKEESKRPVSSSAVGLPALVKEEKIPRVDALLRSLSVLEARELYDALRNIFGGDK